MNGQPPGSFYKLIVCSTLLVSVLSFFLLVYHNNQLSRAVERNTGRWNESFEDRKELRTLIQGNSDKIMSVSDQLNEFKQKQAETDARLKILEKATGVR